MKKRSTSLIAGILCLAAAAAWHSLDVRTGIHETGASWQMGRYLLLIVLVLVLTTVCGYFLLEKAVPCSLPKLAVLMTAVLASFISLFCRRLRRRMRSATMSVLTGFLHR